MNSSNIHLGHLFGIPILVHTTTLWFIFGIALLKGPALALGFALILVVVLLHELGHSLAAKHFGIQVVKISLYPFGGMAQMAMSTENSRHELVVALAGPLTNFVLALPALGILIATGNAGLDPTTGDLGIALIRAWAGVNLALGIFNLVPAFPMDGGRVLRSLLVPRIGYLPATEIAVRVGRWLAAAMIIFAIFGPGPGVGLFFVGVFVYLMGSRELLSARLRQAGGAGADPREMFARMFQAQARGQGFKGFGGFGQNQNFQEQDPREPGDIEIIIDAEGRTKEPTETDANGFSENDIRRLESFHGRLPGDAKE